MTRFKILGAVAILASGLAATPAMAQQVVYDPGYSGSYPGYTGSYYEPGYQRVAYRQNGYWHNSYNRWDDRDRGFWPANVAAGVVGGAVGTAAAIATSPFRAGDAYAYYGGPGYDDSYPVERSYYVQRQVSRRPACGIQPGATYMGPDGRWYPC
jgi:hypothetical protein